MFDDYKRTVIPDFKLNISIVDMECLWRSIASPATHRIENRFSYDGVVRTKRYGLGGVVPELENFYGICGWRLWRGFAVPEKGNAALDKRRRIRGPDDFVESFQRERQKIVVAIQVHKIFTLTYCGCGVASDLWSLISLVNKGELISVGFQYFGRPVSGPIINNKQLEIAETLV